MTMEPPCARRCLTCKNVLLKPGDLVYEDALGTKRVTCHGLPYEVCVCPPKVANDVEDAFTKALGRLTDAINGAKLRHQINESLPPDLKVFGDFLGLLVDPAGAAADITRRYMEKEAAKKKAALPKKTTTRAQRRNKRKRP
jgi:hypothetical protein